MIRFATRKKLFAISLLACSGCAASQSLPTLDALKGLSRHQIERRLGAPDQIISQGHVIYIAKGPGQAGTGLSDDCALHIAFDEQGSVISAVGVESDLLCRQLIQSKGF